jgi:CHASE2 domain-containing sensor protein
VKALLICVGISAVALAVVYHFGYRPYSDTITWSSMAAWGVASIILAGCERRLRYVYWGSVVLAAPSISYSMLGYGALEMGGFIHALIAGVYAVPFWYLFQYLRKRRERSAEPSTGANAASPRRSV